MRFLLLLSILLLPFFTPAQSDRLMPVPAKLENRQGQFRLDQNFRAYISGSRDTRATEYLGRVLMRLDGRTGLLFNHSTEEVKGAVKQVLSVKPGKRAPLKLGEDESYILEIRNDLILLDANTDLGAIKGLETLLQLLSVDGSGYYFPCLRIEDRPRFPWRGLLMDVCRHWMPMDVVKRNIDGMAAMKLNVLHLHLTEDQGFRIESKHYPKLHQLGSNGNYYTQDQMREIIRYADERGIRVIPEFDMPGHATSWFPGHPELASAPGPYAIEKGFGVFDPTLDPTKESTYEFLEIFLREMSALFPDEYLHIGGDENNGKQWEGNAEIQAWMKSHKITDNHALQAYFNTRVNKMLSANGKKMVGWDEILQPELPNNIVIQSWRGKEALVNAAKNGYKVMLSSGYYIDLCQTAEQHYLNDPVPAEAAGLNADQMANILGGEATMWAELVTPETVDSRIWPRTCAIAERFWSPAEVKDVPDMYRRLALISPQLEELGLRHISYQNQMMRRSMQGRNLAPLRALVDCMEPLKGYKRHSQGVNYTTDLPLTRLPDICQVESPTRLSLVKWISEIKDEKADHWSKIENEAKKWSEITVQFSEMDALPPMIKQMQPAVEHLNALGKITLEAVSHIKTKKPASPDWAKQAKAALEAAKKPVMEAEIAIVKEVEELVTWASSMK